MNPEPTEATKATEPTRELFFRWLFALVNPDRPDRGTLAALRRGAGEAPGSVPAMFPLIETRAWSDADPDAMYRTAALFAMHHQAALEPKEWPPLADGQRYNRSLGASLRIAARGDDGSLDTGIERRLIALLDTRKDDIDAPLRQLFSLMKARKRDTPVDFRQLYDDLHFWGPGNTEIKRRWAAGFWRGSADAETSPEAAEPDPDAAN